MNDNNCTRLLTGFGEIAYGKQYPMGNRVYDSNAVAMAVCASPVGNLGGQTYLYLVVKKVKYEQWCKNHNIWWL